MAMQLLAIIKILDQLKFGQYSEVHKFACVYLKIPPNQYVKKYMMQYGIELSTKVPSETDNNFEKSNLKANIFK